MTIMKLWDSYPAGLMVAGIALCLSGAIWFEILALRQARLSMVYVAMLGAEAIMLAAVARFGFGESLMPREIAGATLIIIGTLVALRPEQGFVLRHTLLFRRSCHEEPPLGAAISESCP